MTSSNRTDLGNKPPIVIIGLLASIFGIIAFISGRQSILDFFPTPTSINIQPTPIIVTVIALQPTSLPTEITKIVIITATKERPTATLRIPTATSRPPTSIPTSAPSNVNQSSNANQYARISDEVIEVNLRNSPGYINKDDYTDVIVKIPKGALVEIIGGPREQDGLTWWEVSWSGYDGWIADHTGAGRTIMIFNP